jgi:hypothetical protein
MAFAKGRNFLGGSNSRCFIYVYIKVNWLLSPKKGGKYRK